jgi:hypothetical protein
MTQVGKILDELKKVYDNWAGIMGSSDSPTGRIVDSIRRGDGFVYPDEEGYIGAITYTIKHKNSL